MGHLVGPLIQLCITKFGLAINYRRTRRLRVCLLFNQPLTSAQELRRILYGTTASPSHLPIWVAKDAGFFEKAGLDYVSASPYRVPVARLAAAQAALSVRVAE